MKSWVAAAAAISLMTAGLAVAAPQGRGRGNGSSDSRSKVESVSLFGSVEIRLIHEYFDNPKNLEGLPPGLAKKEGLPPGLAKQLKRNGSLPPGLEKRIQPLPQELEVKLPRRPDGHKRIILAGAVILIDEKIGKILDVLGDVF